MNLRTEIAQIATRAEDAVRQMSRSIGLALGREPRAYTAPLRPPMPDDHRARHRHLPADAQAQVAATHNDAMWLQQTIRAGADVNFKFDAHGGDTLLMRTLRHGALGPEPYRASRLLATTPSRDGNLADLFLTNDAGDTVFHVAATLAPEAAMAVLSPLLLSAEGLNADLAGLQRALDAPDAKGRTPEEAAEDAGQPLTARFYAVKRRFLEAQREVLSLATVQR